MHSGTFWNIYMHYGTFCMHFEIFWNIPYAFWNILEHSEMVQNILELSDTFWNILGHSISGWPQTHTHTHGQTDIRTCWAASSQLKNLRKENAFLNNLESFSLEQEFHIYKYLKYLSYNQSSVCIEIPWLDVRHKYRKHRFAVKASQWCSPLDLLPFRADFLGGVKS